MNTILQKSEKTITYIINAFSVMDFFFILLITAISYNLINTLQMFFPFCIVFLIILVVSFFFLGKKNSIEKSNIIAIHYLSMTIFSFILFRGPVNLLFPLINIILLICNILFKKRNNFKIAEIIFSLIIIFVTILYKLSGIGLYSKHIYSYYEFLDVTILGTLLWLCIVILYGVNILICFLFIKRAKIIDVDVVGMKQPEVSSTRANKAEDTTIEDLKALKELLDCGAISQEEFDKKKSELLNL